MTNAPRIAVHWVGALLHQEPEPSIKGEMQENLQEWDSVTLWAHAAPKQ